MNRSESKYFTTARRMDDALVELLSEKDFEYVTVKEICERAGVSRSTFYLHYRTVGDLLEECIEGIMHRFLSCFDGLRPDFSDEIAAGDPDALVTITPEFVVPYLSFVRDNLPVFRAAVNRPQVMRTDLMFQRLYKDVIDPVLARFGVADADRRYYALFHLNGIAAIVREWVEGGCVDAVEHVADIISQCVLPSHMVGHWAKAGEADGEMVSKSRVPPGRLDA